MAECKGKIKTNSQENNEQCKFRQKEGLKEMTLGDIIDKTAINFN